MTNSDLVTDRRGVGPPITCTTHPSWMFVRRPTLMLWTSPRRTAFIQTLLSAPTTTSPMIWAL